MTTENPAHTAPATPTTTTPSRLTDYVRLLDWREEHGAEVFRTNAGAEWFIRKHRVELIDAGVLLTRRGSGGTLVHRTRFEPLALEILQREAREDALAKEAAS